MSSSVGCFGTQRFLNLTVDALTLDHICDTSEPLKILGPVASNA